LIVLFINLPCFAQNPTTTRFQIGERQDFQNGKIVGSYYIIWKEGIPLRVAIQAKYKYFALVYKKLGQELPHTILYGCSMVGYKVHHIRKNESLDYNFPATEEYSKIIVAFIGEKALTTIPLN